MGAFSWLFGPNITELKHANDVVGLAKALRTAFKAETRAGAAAALGDLRSTAAAASLTEALNDRSALVRQSAAQALSRVADDEAIHSVIAAFCGSPTIDSEAFLRNQHNNVQQTITAMTLLKTIAHPEIEKLIRQVSWHFRKCIRCGNVQFDGEYATRYESRRREEVKARGYTAYVNLGSVDEKCLKCDSPIVSSDPMAPETHEQLLARYEAVQEVKRESARTRWLDEL